jgi:hypothetical protein
MGDDFDGSCGGSGGEDVSFLWTVPFTGTWEISSDGSSYDTLLHLWGEDCSGELACDDDGGEGTRSMLTMDMVEGETITIVIDGFSSFSSGTYQLNIEELTPEPPDIGDSCGDGQIYDCLMNCVAEVVADSWIGDGTCDDGAFFNLDCEEFDFDGGDCGEEPVPDGSEEYAYTGSPTEWVVPAGVYEVSITVDGSAGAVGSDGYGGTPGMGASMTGTFATTPGDVLTVYAGGYSGAGAGGDCSYVASGVTPWAVAGGGGGSVYGNRGADASTGESGVAAPGSSSGTPGAGGTGGYGGYAGTGSWGTAGGGGWSSAGYDSAGGTGGAIRCMGSTTSPSDSGPYAAGAGGGYSGGGGAAMDSGWGTTGGGAGGSYNDGMDQVNDVSSSSTGTVTIAWGD